MREHRVAAVGERSGPLRWQSVAGLLAGLAFLASSCAPHAGGSVSGTKANSGQGGSTASTSTSPTSTVAPLPPGKVTVLEIGDSLGIDLGWGLQWALAKDPHVSVVADAKGDTGLVNTAYYNWPSVLSSELQSVHPQILVVFLGANDAQSFYSGSNYVSFGSAAWKADYAKKVSQMMTEGLAANAKVVWVGEPVMQDPHFSSEMALIDSIFRQEAAKHPGVMYFSSWPVFTTSSGAYNGGTTDITGTPEILRDSDGIHLATGGEDLLAAQVVKKMRSVYNLP